MKYENKSSQVYGLCLEQAGGTHHVISSYNNHT